MKYQILFVLSVLYIIEGTNADCGCLKCNKNLQVVSPPSYPYQVIVNGLLNGLPCQKKPLFYVDADNHGLPVYPIEDYSRYGSCAPIYAYKYQLQKPVIPPPPASVPLTGLVARPDRVVYKPNCPVYTGDNGSCEPSAATLPCRSIFQDNYVNQPVYPQQYGVPPCGCRYSHNTRKKRDLPIIKQSVSFLINLLPRFLRYPLQETLRSLNYEPKLQKHTPNIFAPNKLIPYHYIKVQPKPSETFLEKLQKLNRKKRSLVFEGDHIRLPFLKITDVENQLDDDESEESEETEDDEEEILREQREQYLKPLNFNHIVPHNPIFYLLNAPIRFLHQFHKFGQQFSPVFKSVPHVFINSRKYLKSLGRNFKNDVLNFASNLIGDFDELDVHHSKFVRPSRFRRSLGNYEPEYSLVFENKTQDYVRKKRYILKVVDEDEVEKFLREKLGEVVETQEKPKKKKSKDSSKRRLVVEQLTPKVIIDNKGRPFVDIDGVKRPLRLKNLEKLENSSNKPHEDKEEPSDVKEKINSLINEAKEKVNSQSPTVGVQQNVPQQMIKDRINQILTEIQNLINLDIDKYSVIHTDLYRIESSKILLTNEWKKDLMENKHNDMSSRIRLLDDFKELQILRDKAVEDIASVLSTDSNFMNKKLVKILVRLQKLQCIIYKVVEDFGEKIQMGTEFDLRKEIKYVDYLSALHFVVGRTKHDLEEDLRRERDFALKNEMEVLENLRKLLEANKDDPQNLYNEAKLLWEIKNIDKLQRDTVAEMNEKISRNQKVRKELKILFDLQRQLENCEEKQKELFKNDNTDRSEETEIVNANIKEFEHNVEKPSKNHHQIKRKRSKHHTERIVPTTNKIRHKTIVEDKRPIKLVSNGYKMTAYKISDGFD